jgi:putative ABC transport system permease protein
LNALPSTLEQGLIYALLALGVLITYTILDFPDLSVDGTFPLGGVISTTLVASGAHPALGLVAALAGGALAGLVTGLIHVKLKVRDLFSGIIMATALYSINLRIASGKSLVTIGRKEMTLFQNNALSDALEGVFGMYGTLVLLMLIVLLMKVLLDLFLRTKAGYLLRAVGDNELVVTSLACDKGRVKIIGLMIANSFAALSGAVLCQHQRMFEISMGTGAMVLGLASVIIGLSLLRRLSFVKATTAVAVGAVVYKMCVSFAIACGMGASDLKLITATLFLLILAAGLLKKGRKEKRHA